MFVATSQDKVHFTCPGQVEFFHERASVYASAGLPRLARADLDHS
jgi:hypothetical protein